MRQHILVLFTSIKWIILEIKSQAGLSTGAAALIEQGKNVFSETSLEERRNQITPENQCILCFLQSLISFFWDVQYIRHVEYEHGLSLVTF